MFDKLNYAVSAVLCNLHKIIVPDPEHMMEIEALLADWLGKGSAEAQGSAKAQGSAV